MRRFDIHFWCGQQLAISGNIFCYVVNLESGNYNILTIYFEGTEQIENLERRITYNKAGHQTGDQFQRASTISPNLFSFLNDPRRCIMKFLPLEERKKLTLLTFRVDFWLIEKFCWSCKC